MKIDFQDRIDDYLLNRMSDNDRKTFEIEVSNDLELQDQLKYTEKVRKAIDVRNERLTKMKEWENEYVREKEREDIASEYRATGSGYDYCPASANACTEPIRKEGWLRTKGRIYWMSGMAAMLILGVFLIPSLFFTNTPSFVDAGTFRSGSDYSDIEQLIVQKQYEDALCAIRDSSIALTRDSLAIVHDDSINEERREYGLLIVVEKQDDLEWLKIQALLGLERKQEALGLLDEMRKKTGYYQLNADSLYIKIKK